MSLLDRCKLGFRAERIKTAEEEVCSGELDFDFLFYLEYRYARERTMKLCSIGKLQTASYFSLLRKWNLFR